MKKKAIIGLLLSFTLSACNTITPMNTENKNSDIVKSSIKTGNVTLNYNPLKNFNVKGVNFSNTMITKLRLDIMGSGFTTVSQTVNYTVGQSASFNLAVPAGNNRILSLYALDANDNVLSALHGAVNVTANQTSNAKISYFETVVGQVLANILNGTNPSVINNVNLTNLRNYIVNITGFEESTNKFSKISPAMVDSVSIANYMTANNGALPPDTFANAQGVGTVNIIGNQTGLSIMISDLNSTAVQSSVENNTAISNVSPGMWKITVMKNGSQAITKDVKVTAGQTVSVNADLTGSKVFNVMLNGAQEVPPVNSTATANATVILNDDNTAMVSLKLNSVLSSTQTDAHIHGPAAAGTNAGVLFPLPLGSFSGYKITLTPTQVQQMRDGLFYINMHSTTSPGGEIRGQIMPSGAMVMSFNKTVYAIDSANNLLSFMASNPSSVTKMAITGLQANESILEIDFRPVDNKMYALGSSNRLYTIDGTTGVATAIGATAFSSPALNGTDFGFDFNPVADRLRVHANTTQNLRLNQLTGANAATDTNLAYKAGDANVGATPNVVGTAYTNSLPFPGTTELYAIDSNLDILVKLASPNDGQLTTVGALGVNTNSNAEMDIDGETGKAYAVLSTTTSSSGFYSVNLTTGAMTLLGNINNNTTIRSMAIKP